jgi:hypothetical protein
MRQWLQAPVPLLPWPRRQVAAACTQRRSLGWVQRGAGAVVQAIGRPPALRLEHAETRRSLLGIERGEGASAEDRAALPHCSASLEAPAFHTAPHTLPIATGVCRALAEVQHRCGPLARAPQAPRQWQPRPMHRPPACPSGMPGGGREARGRPECLGLWGSTGCQAVCRCGAPPPRLSRRLGPHVRSCRSALVRPGAAPLTTSSLPSPTATWSSSRTRRRA